MKSDSYLLRIEPEVKRFLEHAAAHDRRSLNAFLTHAALERAEQLRANGWKAKPAPQSRDARRKQVAA